MAPPWVGVAGAAVLGSAVGSFLNVCIYRLPRNESLVSPPSHCPSCGQRIAWYDNVPVLGWVLLAGRCRRCRTRISPQYPLIEATVAALWGLAFWYWGITWHALAGAVFGTILLGIALTDARHYIIPNEFTWGGLGIGLLLSLPTGLEGLGAAALGAVLGYGLLYAVGAIATTVLKKEAMGGGDVRMMAMVGSFVGWKGVLLTIFLGSLLGTVLFVPLAWLTRRHPHWQRPEGGSEAEMPYVPFGIFLAAGAALTFVAGDALLAWYQRSLMGG
jgi:leader peptidase (prepilin peptidase)/N-methyltransferase